MRKTTKTKAKSKAPVKAIAAAPAAPTTAVAVVAPAAPPAATPQSYVADLGSLERVLLQGDLAALNTDDRVDYYRRVCATVGLNPLTKPFEYLTLDGKLVLYATRNCSDQLCFIHRLSVAIVSCNEENELMIVRARVTAPDGRSNEAMGVVDLKGMSGKFRANAMMRAETKAKRRAIMSMCGLSFIDETEVEDVPRVVTSDAGNATLNRMEAKHAPKIEQNPSQAAAVFVQQEQSTHPKDQNPPTHSVGTHPPIDDNPPTHSARQISSAPEDRREPANGETSDDGEIIEHEEQKAPKRNSAGTAYPNPPDDVIAHLKERRYIKWLTWVEQLASDGKVTNAEAFTQDFKAVIGWVRKYGGAHWRRCKAAFAALNITLED